MSNEYNMIKKKFHHDVVEGTYYEIGKQQAEIMKKRRPESANWFAKKDIDPRKLGFNNFENIGFCKINCFL